MTSRIFKDVPQNVVFLNCLENSWYLDGIPALGDSIEEATAGLQELLDHLGIGQTRKTFWGGSMGGFGAVVYGALMNAELIVATGAELELLVAGGNTELILKQRQGRSHFPELPLESWVRQSKGRYFLYCGDFAYHDLVSAKRIMDCPQVHVGTLKDFGHPLPAYLEDVYGLHEFLKTHEAADATFSFTKGEAGVLQHHFEWWADLHSASVNSANADVLARLSQGMERKLNIPDHLAAHCGYALSKGASAKGDHAAAIEYAAEALRIGGPCRFLIYRHIQASAAAGYPFSSWMEAAITFPDLENPNRFEFGNELVELLFNGLMDSHGPDAAKEFLAIQLEKSAAHPKRVALLKELSTRADARDRPWKAEFTPSGRQHFIRQLLDQPLLAERNQRLLITGAVLTESPEDRLVESSISSGNATILHSSMDLASPGLAKKFPDTPHAGHSRFKIEILLSPGSRETVTLCGKNPAGLHIDWLTIHHTL